EDFLKRDGPGLRFRQLARPWDARLRLTARPAAVEFGVTRRLFSFRACPVMPAHRPHDFRHFCIQKYCSAVRAPGPAEIRLGGGILARDFAMREDETERLVGRRRGRRDVSVPQTVNMAILKKSRRGAEDEIHVTRDVAVFKILAAAVEQNRVLPSQKA